MRAVIQRVASASVEVDAIRVAAIGPGLLALVGVGRDDGPADVAWMASKVCELRVFEDAEGRMNRSVREMRGDILAVSQFTVQGDCRRGRRPSFDGAAAAGRGRELFDDLVQAMRAAGVPVQTGVFGARMRVTLVNDGPVTLLLDSRKTF